MMSVSQSLAQGLWARDCDFPGLAGKSRGGGAWRFGGRGRWWSAQECGGL